MSALPALVSMHPVSSWCLRGIRVPEPGFVDDSERPCGHWE